jgi:fermentation-respiration switch protein FrsA (DUF1100 family)
MTSRVAAVVNRLALAARSVVTTVATILPVGLFALTPLWAGQRRMIYFPLREVPPPSAVGLDSAVAVVITTEDGVNLHAWFVPSRPAGPRFTVIVFNGNAGNRSHRATLAAALAERGVASVLFDYRGYGENPGVPSEEGLARDARAVRDQFAARADVDSARLVYFGESLGAAVALRLAIERPPLALILRSPFTSLADIGRRHYPVLPVHWMLRDRYPSLDLVGRLTRPVLVITGEEDEIVPLSYSERLYAAAPEPKRLLQIPGAHHNDFQLLAGARLLDEVLDFVTAVDRNRER